jgi:fermentation-respiration switch protein FrsA (DUF1100 family)
VSSWVGGAPAARSRRPSSEHGFEATRSACDREAPDSCLKPTSGPSRMPRMYSNTADSGDASLGASASACFLAVVFSLGCNNLFYYPSQTVYSKPKYPHDDVELVASDGVHLHGWLFPAVSGPARGTFVHFHGNAGNVTSHYRQLDWVVQRGYQLFTFDYRGYGRSDPVLPTPEGVHRDALAALEYVASKHRALPAFVYGQSLGGAVALRAAADVDPDDLAGIVVEGTFHSYQEVAASVLWRSGLALPATGFAYWWVSDEYAPAPHIENLSPVPLLVIHGRDDRVVSYDLGLSVYALAREPKAFWGIPGGGHIDFTRRNGGAYRDRLMAWTERALVAYEARTHSPDRHVSPAVHARKQAPQWWLSAARSISQPVMENPSQFANPESHVAISQLALPQVPCPCSIEHDSPHAPQAVSVSSGRSQPL